MLGKIYLNMGQVIKVKCDNIYWDFENRDLEIIWGDNPQTLIGIDFDHIIAIEKFGRD